MPITHATIPVPPGQVGQTEWAEEHTLPTAAEIGALVTADIGNFITADSVSAAYLKAQDASTTYARQASAVTTAQLTVYLLSQDASTTYARQASAVTTAQLSIYLTSASAEALFAPLTSAVTTAQLAVYLLSQDASTTYARQASAVTTAQLSIYLTSASASTVYARQASAVTTAQLAVYLLSQDASTTYARQVSAVTTAQLNNVSAGVLTSGTVNTARLGTGNAGSAGVFLAGDSTWIAPPVGGGGITEASADSKYGTIYFVAADLTSNSNSTITTIPSLIVSCSASTIWRLEGHLVYRSSATTTNLGVMCSVTPTPGVFMFGANIWAAATDGTGAVFTGYASANGDIVIGASTNMAAADLPLDFMGTIVTGASNGQIQIGFRSEVSGSAVVIRRGSSMRAIRIGAT